ncbi:MAG: endolytic transglycosylase MltG [Candidatus Levybacteria bacterium]|nr:endolytic transglycosylase MltG [Candidatus Levybacteria bacterium]
MKRFIVAIVLIGLAILIMLAWWNNGTAPVNANDKSYILFVVPQGSGIRAISNDLKEQKLIRDDVVFFLLVKQLGIDKKIQAGDFRLSPSMSAEEIAKSLTTGTLDIWVTIPEGKRSEEIADILKSKLPTYDETWRDELVAYEGHLFPDTYLIPKDATADQVISLLRNTFDERFSKIENHTSLTPEEIVILASMIEREARHDVDRPLVSSVMQNRLQRGMALDIDATIQYALGYSSQEKTWWKKNLTLQDLNINSLYNTYDNPGLPPGPICNPGMNALQAAANPADTDYLFYITDKSGINRYARTNEEHNANIKKYGL